MEEAIKLLKKYNQEKVLKELEKNKNPELIEQILNMNFDKIEDCKQKIGKEEQLKNDKIENISYIDGNKLTKEDRDYYQNIGKDIISKGKYAVVTMAGGQRNKTWTYRAKRNIYNRCKTKAKIFIWNFNRYFKKGKWKIQGNYSMVYNGK